MPTHHFLVHRWQACLAKRVAQQYETTREAAIAHGLQKLDESARGPCVHANTRP